MVAEFGIDCGWLDHPSILERLWLIGQARWDARLAAQEAEREAVKQNQYDRMHAKLSGR